MKEEEVKGNSSTFQIRWTWLLCAFWLHYFLFIIFTEVGWKRDDKRERGATVCPAWFVAKTMKIMMKILLRNCHVIKQPWHMAPRPHLRFGFANELSNFRGTSLPFHVLIENFISPYVSRLGLRDSEKSRWTFSPVGITSATVWGLLALWTFRKKKKYISPITMSKSVYTVYSSQDNYASFFLTISTIMNCICTEPLNGHGGNNFGNNCL